MDEKTYVIVYKHTHKVDRYEEDPDSEYGREYHYLDGDTKVETKEVLGFEAMQKECQEIGEANADNPPYDEYHIVVVYEKESHNNVPEHYWVREESVEDLSVCETIPNDNKEEISTSCVRCYSNGAELLPNGHDAEHTAELEKEEESE